LQPKHFPRKNINEKNGTNSRGDKTFWQKLQTERPKKTDRSVKIRSEIKFKKEPTNKPKTNKKPITK
jgi:hypothetical protein